MVEDVQIETLGTEGSPEAVPGADAGSAGQGFELDGESYTPDQLKEAVDAWRNRDSWERTYKIRDQRMAHVRKAVEMAFDKSLDKMDENDLRDIMAFGIFNRKLRSDPEFADAWEKSLRQNYQRKGMSPAAAAEKAEAVVDKAKAGELPPEVAQKLGRVDELEKGYGQLAQIIVGNRLNSLEKAVESSVMGVSTKLTKDMPEYSDFVVDKILYKLSGYSNEELLQLEEEGKLDKVVEAIGRRVVKTMTDYEARVQKTKAEAANRVGKGVAPIVKGGGAGAPAPEDVTPRPGRGLSGMSDRFFKNFATRTE